MKYGLTPGEGEPLGRLWRDDLYPFVMTVVKPRNTSTAKVWWGGIFTATLLTIVAIVLLWVVAVPRGPEVCGLSYPGPRNCFTEDRMMAGVLWSTVLGVLYVALLLVAFVARRRVFVVAGITLLVLASVAAYIAVAWVPVLG